MIKTAIIKKLPNGHYRLYSRKKDKSGKRKNLGTFNSRSEAEKHEKAVWYFKGHGADDQDTQDNETKALKAISEMAQYLENAGLIEKAEQMYAIMGDIDQSLEDASMIPDAQRNAENINNLGDTGFSQGTFNAPEAERLANLANKLDKMGEFELADQADDILTTLANPYDYEIDEMRYEEEMENKRMSDLVQKVKRDYNDGIFDNLIKNNRIETYLAKAFGMNPNNDESMGFLNGLMVAMEAIQPNEAGGNPEAYQSALTLWNNPYDMDNVDMLTHSNGLQGSTNDATNQFNGLSDSYFYRSYDNLDNRYKIAP
jgi:hypothetical protein